MSQSGGGGGGGISADGSRLANGSAPLTGTPTKVPPPVPVIQKEGKGRHQILEEKHQKLADFVKNNPLLQDAKRKDHKSSSGTVDKEASVLRDYLVENDFNVYEEDGVTVVADPVVAYIQDDFPNGYNKDYGSRWWGVKLTQFDMGR